MFSELTETGLIAVRGPDASAFLHAQLTSDIAGLRAPGTQYSGYCSPKGRLIATFLVWRFENEFLLQLPQALRESVQARLSKYVLRARVQLTASQRRLFCLWGCDAAATIEALAGTAPERVHAVSSAETLCVTRLPLERYLIAVEAHHADHVRAQISAGVQEQPEAACSALDIAAGVPVITEQTQDQYVPQMVNLELIGGVSYTKGCYPGQEIVARTHYLGRLKQRMYRVHIPAAGVSPGDPLYSAVFGPDQASGTVLNVAPLAAGGHDALAVIQAAGVRSSHWKSADGPKVEVKALPYPVTETP